MMHLDLCSGIGGFHLAAGWAGFDTVGFSEIEPYCCALLAERWPDIHNYGDIRTADFSGLRGRITVLSAGVPCQPASLAGKRRGSKDDRWLWPAVLDVVRDVQPAWLLLENHVGILTLDEFGGILLRLESLGYTVRAFSVPANAVGAKHRRQRVFIVANASGRRCNGSQSGESEQQGGTEVIGTSQTLADTASTRCGEGQPGESRAIRNGARWPKSDRRGDALANPNGYDQYWRSSYVQMGRVWSQGKITQNGDSGATQWLIEPAVGRVAHGVHDRSHRLKTLGNAVVPQQAYPFFAAIAQVEKEL